MWKFALNRTEILGKRQTVKRHMQGAVAVILSLSRGENGGLSVAQMVLCRANKVHAPIRALLAMGAKCADFVLRAEELISGGHTVGKMSCPSKRFCVMRSVMKEGMTKERNRI